MRKALGLLLLLLGVFGVVLAVLLPTVVVPASKKTPLDLDITQVSSGPARLYDAATGKTNDVDLRATRIVRTDTSASNDDLTTVFAQLCIVVVQGSTPNCIKGTNDPRLLKLQTDRVTADRKSAESVHVAKWQENIDGDTSVRHEGLSYKFPIDTEKKTYRFFLPDLRKAFPAEYQGTETVAGLTTYKFVSRTGDQPYKIQGIADGTYNDVRTVWVEPKTGAIIKGNEKQVQTLEGGQVALDANLSFEKSAIDYQSNYAKDKIDQLRLAQVWAPIGAAVLGLAALVGGFLVLRGGDSEDGGRGRPRRGHPDVDPDPEHAEPGLSRV